MIPEFSRPVSVESLPGGGRNWNIEATPEECALLATRLRILSVTSCVASLKAKPMSHGDIVRVTGTLTAHVVQACVVSLEPVAQVVEESFDLTFSPAMENAAGEIDIDLSLDDPPDPIYDGHIDLGEIVAEHLALTLDPFPRLENAEVCLETIDCEASEEKSPSPFAVLAELAKKKSS